MNCAAYFTWRCRQSCLGSLCLAGFIYCQAWCWSALLFVPDPLPAATKPAARGRNLDEEKQHIWVRLKPSKRSLPCFWLLFNPDGRPKETRWRRICDIFGASLVFSWTCRLKGEAEPGKAICGTETGSRGDSGFLKGQGNERIRADITCSASH